MRRLAIALSLGFALAVGLLPAARWLLWRWELNPVLRGRLLAEEAGCLSCHVPYRGVEIPNPGSRWGSVPRFQAGNFMMYGETPADIEEFIRYGAPRAWLDDPDVAARLSSQRLRMPAYGEHYSDQEIADLVAFAGVMEGVGLVEGERVSEGRQLAREHGCLACHGVEGSGGLPNPGSFGGFIPGFVGRNFSDLVADEAEFEEWVLDGTSSRLAANPVARFFWQRQKLSMPSYRETLDEQQVAAIWSWIEALRAPPSEAREP
ncbi:MAG: c-type cytochrome [Acidobacteriota bacterium]